MIVEPDFLDHWKTKLLVDLLGDPAAPLYVLRLWGHCQNRKTHGFPRVNPAVLKAICHASNFGAEQFEAAMVEAGFVEVVRNEADTGDMWVVHDWDVTNASLIANWENGKKGGRPKKKTHGKPMGSERVNPSGTDREDREDREEKTLSAGAREGEIPAGLRGQVDAVLEVLPRMRELDVVNTIRGCPERLRAQAVADFVADVVNRTEPPESPLAYLRTFMRNAEKFAGKQGVNGSESAGIGRYL